MNCNCAALENMQKNINKNFKIAMNTLYILMYMTLEGGMWECKKKIQMTQE